MFFSSKYIIVETVICCFINAIFSFCFSYVVFRDAVSISGQDLLLDTIPQSFFVAFFAVFPATLLARRRLEKGVVAPLEFQKNRLPKNAFARSLVVGILAVVFGVSAHYGLLSVFDLDNVSFGQVLAFKTLYGVVVTLVITPYVLKRALAEIPPSTKEA